MEMDEVTSVRIKSQKRHELAHIISKNHDTQFKAVLDKHLPLWEKYKNELNEFII